VSDDSAAGTDPPRSPERTDRPRTPTPVTYGPAVTLSGDHPKEPFDPSSDPSRTPAELRFPEQLIL